MARAPPLQAMRAAGVVAGRRGRSGLPHSSAPSNTRIRGRAFTREELPSRATPHGAMAQQQRV